LYKRDMGGPTDGDRRGILNPRAGDEHFTLARHAPGADLAGLVDRYWTVRWDLRGRAPYEQETLPYPCVNMVLGTHRPGVHGVCTTRFVARLEGEGWVVGIKFRPGGFRPFVSTAMGELTDRELPVRDVFGTDGDALDRAVHAARRAPERIALVESFLRARLPRPDADALEAARVVDVVRNDPAIARVGDLARRAGMSVRALQRLFGSYVGVPPKWVIRRFRVQEAAERMAGGAAVDWSALALDLGYCDQAHFIRDFKAQIGRTPAEYAARCRTVDSHEGKAFAS
jgi:AraC-like DNA-binding protein